MGEQKSNSMRRVKIKADTTLQYLQVFNGIFELTDKEMVVLAKFIDLGEKDDVCSINTKKLVADMLDIEDYNTLNNYVKRLKDKGVLLKNKNKYRVIPYLLPENNVVIQITKSND